MRQKNKRRPNPYLSGVLAVWILLLSLAGVSPALHGWLHGPQETELDACGSSTCSENVPLPDTDHSGEGTHFCGVTALHVGALMMVPIFAPEVAPFVCGHCSLRNEILVGASAPAPYQARAPPIESLV